MGIRIISGEYRGKKLATIQGIKTRPTADRMRESLFNILSHRVKNTRVLDLFAGTGALGIEALSRGAEHAVFIDNYKPALKTIKKNITSCNLETKSKIFNWNISKNLNCLNSAPPLFNLVFMDPPYNTGVINKTLSNLHSSRAIESRALIIIEHSSMEPMAVDDFPFEILEQRRYGKTVFSFLNYMN